MRIRSVMKHDFSHAPQAKIQRSAFNRSHGHKTTFDSGFLIPIFVDEALPGDTFNLKMTALARLATPKFPYMDNMVLDTFFFAVPNRLLWDNWEKFNGAQTNPGDTTDYVMPIIEAPVGGFAAGSIYDYFGIPVGVTGFDICSLPFRAYNLIWNEWFRDENLQNSETVNRGDTPDPDGIYALKRRNKRYDYFTSALPWPQKGPSVSMPLGTQAPIKGLGVLGSNTTSSQNVRENYGTGTVNFPFAASLSGGFYAAMDSSTAASNRPMLYADLSASTAATINQLRQSFQIQKLLERDARGGTRYTEILKSHFGVTSPDARLQRPEYLGGGSATVHVSTVAQTSSTDSQSPQANLSAFGTATLLNNGFVKSFTEHCYIIGLISVRADLNYQQGLNRLWSRQTRYDFYWPALSHIGEQAVLNKEIYTQGTSADDSVFGYQERYAEYRYKPSMITGQFRSSFAQSLDSWHLAQQFSALPVLNSSFIQEDPPVDRIKAVSASYPDFIFDSYFDLKCVRPMPMYSVPGLIDHF